MQIIDYYIIDHDVFDFVSYNGTRRKTTEFGAAVRTVAHNRARRGFTLLELIVVVAIVAIGVTAACIAAFVVGSSAML